MTKIKFERNRKTPSDHEILKNKDFDSVLKQFNAGVKPTKWVNSAKLWGGIVATACLAGVGVFFLMDSDSEIKETPNNEVENVSMEEFNTELESTYKADQEFFAFDPNKDTLLITTNGSVINIPAYAFDTECKNVKLVVNEIDDPVKMFQSKIDMGYDSAGTNYHFESAGMIEIRAFDEQKEINLAQGKEMSIALVTTNEEPSFNLYEKTEDNWDYLGDANTIFKAEMISNSNFTEEHVNEQEHINKGQKEILKVGKVDPSFPTFDVDVSGNSELKDYSGLVFQVDPSEKDFQEDYYLVSWDKIQLEKDGKKYFIQLKRGSANHRFKVNPVMNQKDYADYLNKNRSQQSYLDHINEKKKEFQKKFVDQNFVFNYDPSSTSYMVSNAINKEIRYQINSKSRRLFNIQSIGIINTDRVLPKDIKQKVDLAKFKVKEDGKLITPEVTYVIIPGINTLFTFNGTGLKYYAKKGKTKSWIIKNGKIGILKEKNPRNFETLAFYNAKDGVSKIRAYCDN